MLRSISFTLALVWIVIRFSMGLLLLVPALNVGIGSVSLDSLSASITICLPSVERWVVELRNFTPPYLTSLWN